jgi:hypothetical protein
MSNKNLAIGTLIVLVAIITAGLLAETVLTLQGINPIGVLAAAVIAVIGVAWLKKTAKP